MYFFPGCLPVGIFAYLKWHVTSLPAMMHHQNVGIRLWNALYNWFLVGKGMMENGQEEGEGTHTEGDQREGAPVTYVA